MDPPRLLTHGNHAGARTFCRSEMNVAHFRERISHRIVDSPLADLAAFYMRDRNTQREGDRCWSEHLVSVGDQQQQVRPHLPQQVGQGKHSHAQGLGHAHIGIRTKQTLQPRSNREAILLDLFYCLPERGREMCTEHDQLQVNVRVLRQVM